MLPLRVLTALLFYLLIVSNDVESNPGPTLWARPTLQELENFKKKDESGSIDLIDQIASFPYHRCKELASKLLSNHHTKNFHSYSRDLSEHECKKNFVSELFARWLKFGSDKTHCSWGALASSLRKLDDLGRSLAKDIRKNCEEPDGCSSGHRLFPVLSTNIASRPLNFQLSRKRLSSCTGVSLGQPVCGLQNVGNQCYMNATLQCLSHTRLLRDIFWNLKSCSPSSSSLASGESSTVSSNDSRRKVIQAYAELQNKMWQNQAQVVQPTEIWSAVGNLDSRFAGFSQEDAQEFLTCLLDGLHEGMNRVKKKTYVSMSLENAESWTDEEMADELWRRHLSRNDSKIVEIFHGQIKSVFKCLKCDEEHKTFEPVSQLTLSIPMVHVSDTQKVHVGGKECTSSNESVVDLDDCLDLYVKRKPLTRDCESCGVDSDCVQKFDLWRLPQVLIIHLKRFTVTGDPVSSMQRPMQFGLEPPRNQHVSAFHCCKVNTNVRFPDNLDLSKYLVSKHSSRPYKLYAVINHSGTLYAGHYTACVKEGDSWFLCDDEIVTQVRSVQTSNAYVLFYHQV